MPEAIALANYLIDKANEPSSANLPALTPMKALKLVYYAHGWFFGLTNQPLVNDEQIEAWGWGPVFPSLYHAAKHYGNQPIRQHLSATDWEKIGTFEPNVNEAFADRNPASIRDLLDRIFKVYGGFTAIQLSNSTHDVGSPWYQVYHDQYHGNVPRGTDIPPPLIREYFASWAKTGKPPAAASITAVAPVAE